MEYLTYASMVIVNEGKNIDIEYHFPKLAFNGKKRFKSAWLNFASIGILVTILVQAQVASAAYYVNTNGSCLNARTGPGLEYPTVTCISNGELLQPVVRYYNGFAKLTSGIWVSAEWIGTAPGRGYSPLGVGGEYPDYFRRTRYDYDSYRFSHLHHHRYPVRRDYSYNNSGYSGNNDNYSGYRGNDDNYSGYRGNDDNYPGYRRNDDNYPGYRENNYNHPGYSGNDDNYSGYRGNNYNHPGYSENNYYDYPGYGYRS